MCFELTNKINFTDYKIVKTQDLKTWPSGTGQAAKDWLASQGIVNEELSFRKK